MPLQLTNLPRDSDVVFKIIKKYPYYDKVQIITKTEANETTLPRASFRKLQTSNLFQICLSNSNEETYISAVPEDQLQTAKHFQDRFIFQNGEVKMVLNQSSFQKCPNLQSRYIGSRLRKLKNEKLGHGGNYHAQYRYEITTDLGPPELKYILDTLFSKVEASIYSTNTNLPEGEWIDVPQNITKASIPNCNELDELERYEALTMFANFDAKQILNANEFKLDYYTRYTLENVISSALLNTKWCLLSSRNDSTHILLENREDSVNVFEVL
ncbi:hypothetical protein KGF56_002586 [Candida oxycetoniae]|uniref:Uncharacterized protein n=1 Tax=Candida oxycetoniae TaxID=497107 RepID=A0AAI9WY89_9ASCO|nr:uncharacterized protein KGF56_002586 [Candida oxycetoniae]KAI3404591.2 hypothetical protein KGF56_002586 [Candida oxycetoniae]